MRRFTAIFGFLLLTLAAPAAALAASASADYGSGTQTVSHWYSCGGATLTGQARSTHGDPIYLWGAIVYDLGLDEDYGRYTSNTSSTSWVSRGGNIGGTNTGCGGSEEDGAHFKVCKDISWSPDACSSWSTKISSPWD